jgi:CBS domain containing-hemolysin-like protein
MTKISDENACTIAEVLEILRRESYQEHVVAEAERQLLAAADDLQADRVEFVAGPRVHVRLRANPVPLIERVKRVIRRRS